MYLMVLAYPERMTNNDCPLCHHPLGSEEKKEVEKEFQKLIKKESSSEIQQVEEEARRNQDSLKKELEEIKRNRENELRKVKDDFEKEKEKDKKFFEDFFKRQLDESKKILEKQSITEKKQLEEEKKKLEENLEKIQSKIHEEVERCSKQKIDEIEREYKLKIEEKNVQLGRITRELDEAKKATESTSGEIKGTAGEALLFKDLQEAFPNDIFKCQKRGQMEADIIHSITDAGCRIPMPIVYDNKEKTKITQLDISKAKKYQTIHQTKYVLLVYSEMPKGTEAHLISEKDGILIVHRSAVIEFVRQLRKFLIDLFKTQVSETGRESKEVELFKLIKSPKFESFIKGVENDVTALNQLQDNEEKGHQKIWTIRKKLVENIETTRRTADAEILAILQDNREPIPIDISAQRVLKNKRKKTNTI